MPEKWYRPAELAQIWGISRTMVQKLISQGKLGALRVGDMWRIRESDKLAYENDNYKAATPAAKPMRGVWKIQ